MEQYNKRPLTYKEQIALLKSRGVEFTDEQRAERHLANISYYRLSAYMLPYKKRVNGIIVDEFKVGTTWNTIHQLYVFDRKLRILVFDVIERLEIAIRTQIIYQLSHKYGSHWQDDSSIFHPATTKTLRDGRTVTMDAYREIQKHIKEQLQNNKAEVFIQHYRNKYDNPVNPPSWMSVEIMYFNHLSRICTGLKKRADINGIASYFALPPQTFCSWLHTINYIRNICAHHARLWNREMNIVPEKLSFSKRLEWISNPGTVQRSKIYHFFCMLNYMLQTANPTSSFKQRLMELLEEYKHVISLSAMGFPEQWKEEKYGKSEIYPKPYCQTKIKAYICSIITRLFKRLKIISLSGASKDSILERRSLFIPIRSLYLRTPHAETATDGGRFASILPCRKRSVSAPMCGAEH